MIAANRVCHCWVNVWRETRSTGWIPEISVSRWSQSDGQLSPAEARWKTELCPELQWTHSCERPLINELKIKCIYPWNSEVCHQLFKGPRLLCLLLVVQRDLLAELPGVWATCARGAGHCAGRSFTTSATWKKWRTVLGVYFSVSERCSEPISVLKHSTHYWSARVNSERTLLRLRCQNWGLWAELAANAAKLTVKLPLIKSCLLMPRERRK